MHEKKEKMTLEQKHSNAAKKATQHDSFFLSFPLSPFSLPFSPFPSVCIQNLCVDFLGDMSTFDLSFHRMPLYVSLEFVSTPTSTTNSYCHRPFLPYHNTTPVRCEVRACF